MLYNLLIQDFASMDPDILKLYRLGQYTIEYLLHCQEYLSHSTLELENKLRDAIKVRLRKIFPFVRVAYEYNSKII